ncbi:24119_t:CDS:2, partial [Gigaspora margarita]
MWHDFKADWIKAIVAEIDSDVDKKYHIDIEKWLPTIDSLNNPWIQYRLQSIVDNSIEEENMSLNDLQNTLMK